MSSELWVLEWHQKSNNFHIQPLDKMLSDNRRAYMRDVARQNWIVLVVGTHDECTATADAARPTLQARGEMRRNEGL